MPDDKSSIPRPPLDEGGKFFQQKHYVLVGLVLAAPVQRLGVPWHSWHATSVPHNQRLRPPWAQASHTTSQSLSNLGAGWAQVLNMKQGLDLI